MAQHDYNIANQSFPATRTDINNVLLAIASNNSGDTAPSTTFANQYWYETDSNKLYIRNEDNDQWIELAVLDQTNDIVSSITSETLVANILSERSSGSGVTIDGLLVKDKEIGTSAAPATLQATSLNTGAFSNRNMVINGAMQICQRATSKTGINSSGYYVADRIDTSISTTAGVLTMSQDSDAPDGFGNALKLDCTTADTSVAAGEIFLLMYQFEGQDVQRIQKGKSTAKEVTVSFYAKANSAKTYVVELKDFDNTRTCSKTFTVGTSYARHEITFPADTTGVLDDDTERSLSIHFFLHAGSTYTSGTLQTAWGSQVDANRAAGIGSFFDSTDNTFFITGLQMELGSVATEFEHRTFGDELEACQRYYKRLGAPRFGTTNYAYITGASVNANAGQGTIHHHPEMRANPTVEHTGTATDYKIKSQNSNKTCSSVPQFTSNSRQSTILWFTASGLLTSGLAVHLQNATTDGFVAFDAEL